MPLYTFSRVRRQHDKDAEKASGSGWSREGMIKFGEIANSVKRDRDLNGTTFNNELYKVFTNRKRNNKKVDCSIETMQQEAPIYDDMDNDDGSEQDDEQQPYVRI